MRRDENRRPPRARRPPGARDPIGKRPVRRPLMARLAQRGPQLSDGTLVAGGQGRAALRVVRAVVDKALEEHLTLPERLSSSNAAVTLPVMHFHLFAAER